VRYSHPLGYVGVGGKRMGTKFEERTPSANGRRYASQFDGPPPRYTGPDWIGKAITVTRSFMTVLRPDGSLPPAYAPGFIGKRVMRPVVESLFEE
jgi:hypothetical protein